MPLDSLPDSSRVEDGDGTALLERLRHLERLLKEFGTAQPPDVTGDATDARVREALISSRLRPLTEQIEGRVGAKSWDVGDALAARVLLDELSVSLRGCRTVANAVTIRLRETHNRLKEARLKVDREAARLAKDEATRRAKTQTAADQGSTD